MSTAEEGFIELRAIGGAGGHGGNGGRGGDGATGRSGSDATRWSSGGNGGPGGDGGAGGDATSGARGGDGGAITVAVADVDTPLLMLIRHDVAAGVGGRPGINGGGGSGGSGGRGGDSYSWSESESYTDSNGNSQTRTTWHRNPGGSDGPSGSPGRPGSARVSQGANGRAGKLTIEVTADGKVERYDSRYDLRLVNFSHDSLNEDCVYEPGEKVRVFDLEVENVGGMPTPAHDELSLSLIEEGWVQPEPGELQCEKALAAGARHKPKGELLFRIADWTAKEPGDPLEVEESILQRALLPSVRRGFEHYQEGEAIAAGKFVIRFPARLSAPANLRSLATGEATKVKFSITNQSRFALGARSASKRVLRVRVATAQDSELADEHVSFTAEGAAIEPSIGWVRELPELGAGDTAELELTLTVKDGAPEYRRFAAQIALDLGKLDEPASPKVIQYRAFDVRVARPFKPAESDLLLVVNHKTTRDEIVAWEALADRLAIKLGIWDLTRERHLDLEAPLQGDLPLVEWFKGKAIAILDNAIDGPEGPTYPHAFISEDQARRAASAGIDLCYIGKGRDLRRVLVPAKPTEQALVKISNADDSLALVKALTPSRDAEIPDRGTAPVHRRYWLRWWAKPQPDWLRARAHDLSAELHLAMPEQRHVVVHRYAPEVVSKFLWIKKWKVGTLETVRTLDAAAGSIVHLAADDAAVHTAECALRPETTTALLVMFDFDENLARLKALMAAPAATEEDLEHLLDALLVDLANEIMAVLGPGWRGGKASREALERGCPRLRKLADAGLGADYDSVAGKTLIRLAGRLWFFAQCQVLWWESVPPWRWMRRGTKVRGMVRRYLDRFLAGAFGEHNVATTRADVIAVAEALEAKHAEEKESGLAGHRQHWSLELARRPLASQGITSDTEVLATHEERVLSGDELDGLAAAAERDAAARSKLVAAADGAHRDLAIKA